MENKGNRKYIDELKIDKEYLTTFSKEREEQWGKQRKEYGFDERETWAIDHYLYMWLYERLKMYDEINIVNTEFHKYNYEEEEITLQNCIDRMIEGTKIAITVDDYEMCEEQRKKVNDVTKILSLCINELWW